MRRILVLAFAVAATFSVLASNFIQVSAPKAEGAVVYRPAGPNDAARLSEQFAPTAGALIAHAAAAAPAPQPDLAAFEPHASAPAETVENARTATVPEASFVTAQAIRPSASFVKQKLLSLPTVRVMPDVLAAMTRHHSVATSLDMAVAERLAVAPDAASIRTLADLNDSFAQAHSASSSLPALNSERERGEPEAAKAEARFIPLTAGATNIFASIEAKAFAKLPEIVPSSAALTDRGSLHNTGSIAEISTGRINFEAEAPRQRPVTAMFVTAAYQGTESNIFHRARYVVDSYAPAMLPKANAVHSIVAALTETPYANFDRIAFLPDPIAPVSVDTLAGSGTHLTNIGEVASPERVDNVTAEAAPRQTYVPSFLTALAEVPSAVFQKIGLVAMPEAPATADALAENNTIHTAVGTSAWFEAERATAMPDAATIAAKEPVLISTQTAMNADILKPMSAGPLADAPMLNVNAVASNGFSATPIDRMIDTPDVPEAVLKARPVLISSNNDFSTDLLKPMNPVINPFVKLDKAEVLAAMQRTNNYCDPNFVGPPIRFSQTVELKLDDLLRQLHQRFGINFIVGKGVSELPMNIKAGSIPWNVLLKSQLFISGVRARCIDQNTIELVENATLPSLQDMADVETRFVKLKFLQRTGSGTVDLANRAQGGQSGNQGGGCGGNSQGGGQSGGSLSGGGGGGGQQQGQTVGQLTNNKFDKLIREIEKILGLRSMQESGGGGQGGGQGGNQREAIRSNRFVTQIPGRNILAIRATKEEHELIDQIIVRADRPPFQVVIKGLVYSANEDRLRDIGVQSSLIVGTANQRSLGGVTNQPGPNSPTSPTLPTTPGQPNPGGVRTLGPGFSPPSGLGDTIFGVSAILGTAQFSVQATAFQQNGAISVKSRPFATVVDGLCTTLDVGRQLPIVIDSSLGGRGDVVFVSASNTLAVTPYVIDDENGNPIAVTLEVNLAANDIDSSVTARGVPAISTRQVQTQLMLGEDKTAILGGFTVDQDSKTVQKTPGIGDIPIIGQLFKRRIRDTRFNRLYFALSVDVIPYPDAIRPVDVPGVTTDIPSITPEQKKRADSAEPKQVKGP